MKKDKNRIFEDDSSKIILNQIFTAIVAVVGVLIIGFVPNIAVKIILAVLFIAVICASLYFVTRKITKVISSKLDELDAKSSLYESILDAIPLLVSAVDNNMKYTYMNKAFENLMVKKGAIKSRQSAYGLQCSIAKSTLCDTEDCGIRQLKENSNSETYFEWFGYSCKQNAAVIKDSFGKEAGYVEVITNTTSEVKEKEYSNNEIAQLSEYLNMIADGDLSFNTEITSDDDSNEELRELYSKISDSINKVKNSLSTLEDESVKLSEAGVNGDLDVRGDESGLNGIYARIIQGFNQTFDAVKAPLEAASEFIEKLANGDEVDSLDNTYNGSYSTIIVNLNSLRESLFGMLSEVYDLTQIGINGQFDSRGDSSSLQGFYMIVLDNINEMLNAVEIPLNESSAVLHKISLNDYTAQMSDNYNGIFKDFSDSVNEALTSLRIVQDCIIEMGVGDLSRLNEFKKIGKRSENDNILPALTNVLQTVQNLINESNRLASAASDGRLDVRGTPEDFNGSYQQIIEGMNHTMEAFATPIEEASQTLQNLADGDLTVAMEGEYKGEYNRIKTSLNQTIQVFFELIGKISFACEQVASGSKQVSDASQSLSQGTTEQASAVEQLSSSIAEVAAQTNQNASNAIKANELSTDAKNHAADGTKTMGSLLNAMIEINQSSSKISKIIKVIDDIAFQTNMLSLNAAIEAARAGQAGKGFAVVADEVRSLAARSADAAKETSALIDGSISKVKIGTDLSNETAEKLNLISESIDKTASLVGKIATASNEQATAISQIDRGVNQVSSVVQTASATSEETAASSEELFSQADVLLNLIRKFKLNNEFSGSSATNKSENSKEKRQTANLHVQQQNLNKQSIDLGKY